MRAWIRMKNCSNAFLPIAYQYLMSIVTIWKWHIFTSNDSRDIIKVVVVMLTYLSIFHAFKINELNCNLQMVLDFQGPCVIFRYQTKAGQIMLICFFWMDSVTVIKLQFIAFGNFFINKLSRVFSAVPVSWALLTKGSLVLCICNIVF